MSVRRIDRTERPAREEKGVALLPNGRRHWGRATVTMLGLLPKHLPIFFVERDQTGVVCAPNVQQHRVALDQRRADHPMPVLARSKFFARLDLPKLRSSLQVQTMQRA